MNYEEWAKKYAPEQYEKYYITNKLPKIKYAEIYGGNSKEWMKKVGKIESDKYIFDIHFVEHEEYGRYDYKLKGKKLK